jgi:hypothetical protein
MYTHTWRGTKRVTSGLLLYTYSYIIAHFPEDEDEPWPFLDSSKYSLFLFPSFTLVLHCSCFIIPRIDKMENIIIDIVFGKIPSHGMQSWSKKN